MAGGAETGEFERHEAGDCYGLGGCSFCGPCPECGGHLGETPGCRQCEERTTNTLARELDSAEDVIDTALQMMREPMGVGDARAARSALTEWMVERQKSKARARRAADV